MREMSECEVREVDHAQLDVSVVVPLANERETLEELYSQIAAVLAQEERCFEVIFVDDGSADGSWEVIRRLHAAHENVRGIRFRRNFRKAAALAAGFAHARGAIVVTIDADLQDDPRSIVALLRKIAEGNDLVSGWKQDRKDPFTKRIASRLSNSMISTAASRPIGAQSSRRSICTVTCTVSSPRWRRSAGRGSPRLRCHTSHAGTESHTMAGLGFWKASSTYSRCASSVAT